MKDAMYLVTTASELFRGEPNVLTLNDPITVCGDIHGQFFDLLRLLEAAGDPSESQYLFLGDYVDRGCFSMECILYLYAHKITFPKTFWMLRGNHECRHLTSFFNFQDECLYKYDSELYDLIMWSFDCLPISATVNGKFLACHGGLSPDIKTLKDISDINRFQEIPRQGPFCDLMWSDPYPEDEEEEQGASTWTVGPKTTQFTYNDTRQCSYFYGVDAVSDFLERNNLTSIIRAHEACFDGYKFLFISEEEIPRVITIFSAPNYCDVYKNRAACIKFEDDDLNIRQYASSPHPYYLPNFMDVITWSMPFVADKVCEMLSQVLTFEPKVQVPKERRRRTITDVKAKLDEEKLLVLEKRKRNIILKHKNRAMSKMVRFFKVLKKENDNIVKLKALSPSGKLRAGILSKGSAGIQDELADFAKAQEADKNNMRLPGPMDGKKRKNMQG